MKYEKETLHLLLQEVFLLFGATALSHNSHPQIKITKKKKKKNDNPSFLPVVFTLCGPLLCT